MRTFVGSPPGVVDPPDPTLPSIASLTSAPNGGFNPYAIAGAVQSGGTVFISYTDGDSGAAEVIERDEGTGVVTGPTALRTVGADAHNSPALLVRSSDSRIVTVYGPHNAANLYRRISTNPEDSTSWGTESNLDSSLGLTRYSNPQLHESSDESLLFLIFRDEPTAGTDSRWYISPSSNGGSTFGSPTMIYRMPAARSYLVTWSNGVDRLDYFATAAFGTSPYKMGHFYREAGGAYLKTDGSSVGSLPITSFSNISEVWSGTDAVQPGQIAYDVDGTPVVLFYSRNSGSQTYTYWYGRWDGAAWNTTALTTGSASYNYNSAAGDGYYGAAIDDGDVNIVYLIKVVSGQAELFRLVTTDDGATFTEEQVTTGSSGFQAIPIPVRNRGTGLVAAYQYGTWTNYLVYSLGIKGIVLA